MKRKLAWLQLIVTSLAAWPLAAQFNRLPERQAATENDYRSTLARLGIGTGNLDQDGWVDPTGSALAARKASPVYRLLGATDGCVDFRQHDGGHTNGSNWPAFLDFATEVSSARRHCSGSLQ